MQSQPDLKAMSPVPPATSNTFGGGDPASQPVDNPSILTNSSFQSRCIPETRSEGIVNV